MLSKTSLVRLVSRSKLEHQSPSFSGGKWCGDDGNFLKKHSIQLERQTCSLTQRSLALTYIDLHVSCLDKLVRIFYHGVLVLITIIHMEFYVEFYV